MNSLILAKFHWYLMGTPFSRTETRDEVFVALYRLGRCRPKQLREKLTTAVIDRVTIYRTLQFFIAQGIVTRLPNETIELTDRFKQHHHHLVCSHCGKEIGFNDDAIERAIKHQMANRDFRLDSHQVELTGICGQCLRADLNHAAAFR